MRTAHLPSFLLLATTLVHCGGSSETNPPNEPPADTGPAIDSTPPVEDTAPPPVCPTGTKFRELSGKIGVDVTIDGKGPYLFVLDTGAPYSAIDDSLVDKVGSGAHDMTVAERTVHMKSLPPGGSIGSDLRIPGVVGVVGMDFFGTFALTVDYPRTVLWLDPVRDDAAMLACDHVRRTPSEVKYVKKSRYLYVPSRVESTEGWLLVDTGASLGAIEDPVFDAMQASHARPALEGFYTPAAIGTFWARLASVGSIEVAGQRVEHLLVRTIESGILPSAKFDDGKSLLGLLPSGYLHHFMITVDYPKSVLRLDASKSIPLREDSQIFVTGIGLTKTTTPPAKVAQVLPGSAAAEAGVMVGDEVVSAGGVTFATADPYSWSWSLASAMEKAKIPVKLRRDGKDLEVSLETRDLLSDPKP